MKIYKIFIIILLLFSVSSFVYPRFGFSLNYSPVTVIKMGDLGMSGGASLFFDETYLMNTSIRTGLQGDVFFKFKSSASIADTIIPDKPIQGYSASIFFEFLKEFGGQYYSFAAGFGGGMSFADIVESKGINFSIRIPLRISYPVSSSSDVRMYIDVIPSFSIPIFSFDKKSFLDSTGCISIPIGIGFRF